MTYFRFHIRFPDTTQKSVLLVENFLDKELNNGLDVHSGLGADFTVEWQDPLPVYHLLEDRNSIGCELENYFFE